MDRDGLKVGDWWDLPANYGRSEEIANELLKTNPGRNDINDAMRHAIWQKMTVKETNTFTAWSAGVLHEIDNLLNGGKLDETLMDLNNNSEGRKAANDNREIDPNNLEVIDEDSDKNEYMRDRVDPNDE